MPIASPECHGPPAKRAKPNPIDPIDPVESEMALPVEYVKSYDHEIDYRNKLVLAPMVRSGTCE